MKEKEDISGNVFDRVILSKIYKFVQPYKKTFFVILFLTFLAGIISPLRPYLVKYTIDNVVAKNQPEMLVYMCLLMLGFLFTQTIVEYLNAYLSGLLGQSIIKDIRIKLYEHLLNFKLSFYDKTPIGRLITRNISDIETISDIFTEGLADIFGSILQLICIVGLMLYLDWRLTLISLSVIPFLLVSTYVFKEKVKKSFNDVRNSIANLNTFVQEHITGMNIVQIFTAEEREYKKFVEINKQHRNANLKSVLYYSIYFPVAEVLSAAGIGLLVWYGARQALNQEVSLGLLTAFIMYIQMFFRPIREIADKFNTLQMGIVGSSRVLKLLENNEYIPQNGKIKNIEIQGNIKFENVSFSYIPDNPVLNDISFEIKKGEVLAIVGTTGSGKSSTINLLNRFYEFNSGKIYVDGIEINEYDLSFLRSRIGMVLQDVFLFSSSIKDNITLGNKDISDNKIIEAAKAIGAWDFINELPEKLDYKVMERGATLSVGQRQLISFIRAMVYDPQILILDEATASIDSETELLIQNALETLLKNRTSIIIAHRLATIQNADKILVLEKGEIVETGNHETLINTNGPYSHFVKQQNREYIKELVID